MSTPPVLIVDDEKATRDGLRMALSENYEVYVAANLSEAKAVLANEQISALLTDLRLPGESGMDLLDFAQSLPNPPVCIMMSAYGSVNSAVSAMKRGAWSFVTKPIDLDEVEIVLKRALQSQKLEQTCQSLNQQLQSTAGLERLLGRSAAMQEVFRQIRQVAPSRATVLIEGESGTGKELAAQALHQLSGRPAEKFVIVNCAALSPQLLESELFGHEKGAFTGALQRRVGRFEQADGGTLFLDEIGEIDAGTQVRLLRALSERTIERVGSNQPLKVDVRVISATNKSMAELVRQGHMRQDLYYRLNVVNLHLPPLRQREGDLLVLAQAFLAEFARENHKSLRALSPEAFALLQSYSWPGNVRELKTAIEYAVVMSNGKLIGVEDLPPFLQQPQLHGFEPPMPLTSSLGSATRPTPTQPHALSVAHDPVPATLAQTTAASAGYASKGLPSLNLRELEQQAISEALQRCGGKQQKAADLLGISVRTLQRKLK